MGFETIVSAILTRKRFEVFLPSSRSSRHNRKNLEAPLFPGYVFCRTQASRKRSVLNTPGVLHLAGNGSERDFRIPEVELAAIQKVNQTQLLRRSGPILNGGTRVRVMDGPLRNLEGMLVDSGNKTSRLTISVSVIERAMQVEVPKGTRLATIRDNRLPASIQVPA
jgi:transcription antitermination factor NusG